VHLLWSRRPAQVRGAGRPDTSVVSRLARWPPQARLARVIAGRRQGQGCVLRTTRSYQVRDPAV